MQQTWAGGAQVAIKEPAWWFDSLLLAFRLILFCLFLCVLHPYTPLTHRLHSCWSDRLYIIVLYILLNLLIKISSIIFRPVWFPSFVTYCWARLWRVKNLWEQHTANINFLCHDMTEVTCFWSRLLNSSPTLYFFSLQVCLWMYCTLSTAHRVVYNCKVKFSCQCFIIIYDIFLWILLIC